MARFLLIWLGQVFAGCGSNLANFCLGIWLYQQSESVTQFSLLLFFYSVPLVLLASVAGRVADRWNQRRTMMITDGLNVLVALALVGIFELGAARPWLIYLLTFAAGCLSAFQWPAYRSWSTQLVEPRHFGRVGGIMKLGEGIPFLLGPALGGALMATTSLATVFLVDVAGWLVSFAVLATASSAGNVLPSPAEKSGHEGSASRLTDFLRARRGLFGLFILSPFIVFTEGWVVTLFQPFMLHQVDAARMGLMLSLGGSGMVAGGIVMGVWGGPRRQIFSVLGSILVQTLVIGFLAVVRQDFWSGTVAAFLYFAAIPFLSGSNQAIWQALTPPNLQGRMFAFRRATEAVATPASLLTAGVLVDLVLEPWLAHHRPFGLVDAIVPQGSAQPIAVLLLAVAVGNLATLAVALLWRPVRCVDLEPPMHADTTLDPEEQQRLQPELAGAVRSA